MYTLDQPTQQDTLRVSALHAFTYCPRLFYLEEVEELYTQDAAVFAGRRLHVELEKQEDEEWEELFLESAELGLRGRVDALRTRDRQVIPYEHKRGRCWRDEQNQPQAWESDRLQILAYAYLIESALGVPIAEGRIRYHADNVLVHVPLDEAGRSQVRATIEQARQLRASTHRPPVTENERLCARCSLASVCLPEEARLAHDCGSPFACFQRTTSERWCMCWSHFEALPDLIGEQVDASLRFDSRNRRPPRDRFNALLGFGYALLLKDVMNAILTVGLEPALGFYHQLRSQAAPLALDLMEIFRVPLVDMPIVASINRGQWEVKEDFEVRGQGKPTALSNASRAVCER